MDLVVKCSTLAEVCYDVEIPLVLKVLMKLQNILVIESRKNLDLVGDLVNRFIELVPLRYFLDGANLPRLLVDRRYDFPEGSFANNRSHHIEVRELTRRRLNL